MLAPYNFPFFFTFLDIEDLLSENTKKIQFFEPITMI